MSESIALGSLSIFFMFLLYISLGVCLKRYKCSFGHEASFILIIGMTLSWILKSIDCYSGILKFLQFDDNLFFYVCLPPIVFASGFNMHRGEFFANIKIVIIFGVIGTLISFTTFSGLNILLAQIWPMRVYSGTTGKWSDLKLENTEIVLMSSLLCSSDVIAAVSLVSFQKEPALFSIIFGEGITNDAVSIILFNTVLQYTKKNAQFTAWSPLKITGNFLLLGLVSILIGIFFGLLSAFILKHIRAYSQNPVGETMALFCIAYMSYVISEITKNSGIITLLVSGIIMSHYTWYNLSEQGKHSSFTVFEFFSYAMEAFVFVYLGLTVFSFHGLDWSPELFISQIFVIIIGRFIATVGLLGLLKLCKFDSGLSFKQQIFIWFAGMIRGAIAFGLVLRIDGTKFTNRGVIVTTSLKLVIFTTVVFGSLLGLLQKYLFGSDESPKIEVEDQATDQLLNNDGLQNEGPASVDVSEDEAEEEEEQEQHPNFRNVSTKRVYSGCTKVLRRFDNDKMKPFFIYNYNADDLKTSDKHFENDIQNALTRGIQNRMNEAQNFNPKISRSYTVKSKKDD